MRSGGHCIGDAMGDGPGLSRAGPGEHDDGTVDAGGNGPLLIVKAREQGLRIRHPGTLAPPHAAQRPVLNYRAIMEPITMFSTVWCGYCQRLKAQLGREGISFTEVDIEADPTAAAFVESVNGGNQTVPTVVFPDGSALTNPSIGQVKEKLALT